MATVGQPMQGSIVSALGALAIGGLVQLGDFTLFSLRTLGWSLRRRAGASTFLANCCMIGVHSVPVIAITGAFIGLVMGLQMYSEFSRMGLGTRLGAVINMTLVRELGPTLAATMLAGRIGSSIAAELGTMRVTEQVDALACLGVSPIQYLVVPRLLACTMLIPLLTVLADVMGILGGALICTGVFDIEPHYYWEHSRNYIGVWDLAMGLIKAVFFGAAIALISCHRGLNSKPGAEGVGRAATEAFVASFVAILVLNFFIAMLLIAVQKHFFPAAGGSLL